MNHQLAIDRRYAVPDAPADAPFAGLSVCSILTSLTSGGAEMLVANMNAEFVRQGAASTVVSLCDAAALGNSPEMEARLRAQIERDGGSFRSLGLERARSPLAGGWRLRRLLRELAPDVVHAHTARAMLMLGLSGTRAPVLLTHHNSKLSFSPRMFAVFDRVVRGYVAISHQTDEIYRRHASRTSTLIPNAANPAFMAEGPRLAPGEPGRILSVGAVSEQKNYGLLVAAAAALRDLRGIERMPVFEVAGGGPYLETLREEAGRLGLGDRVRFLGERSDVAGLMRGSDLYLNTSLYEGMPVTFLEAMGSALPIVATDVEGNRELVETGRNGVLCPEGDSRAIAQAIDRLLSDRDRYARLSAGAFEAGKAFSLPETARRHLELYASLAGRDG